MKPDFGFWLDLVTEFAWNAANTLVGYITAAKILELPPMAGFVVAGCMGVIGTANHLRALRKNPTA